MHFDSTIAAGLLGATAVFIPSAGTFLIAWGALHATLDALKVRVGAVEDELGAIHKLRDDVSYIRGLLDGGKAA